MWRRSHKRAALVGAVVLALAVAGQAPGQAAGPTPLLDADHWTRRALTRIHDLGAAPAGFDPATAALSLGEAASVLARAAASDDPSAARLARGWLRRLEREYPGLAAPAGGAVRPLAASGSAGYGAESGNVLAGIGTFPWEWTGPRPVEDRSSERVGVDLVAVAWPGVALRAAPEHGPDGLALARWEARAEVGPVGVWAGRRPQRLGGGAGGTIVLSDFERAGVGLHAAEGLTPPGFLRWLGPVRFEAAVSRVDRNVPMTRPWVGSGRLRIEPHPRLSLAVNRGVMFGGEENTPVTPYHLLQMLIGMHSGEGGEFDNHVVAVEAQYRVPLHAFPLVLMLEWGFEDSAGAWRDVPGLLAAVRVPALPFAPGVAVAAELTDLRPSCCGNPEWYKNWTFLEGWTDQGRPIGHPLAGHGREARLVGEWASAGGALLLEAHTFRRSRGYENLYAPQRADRSTGGSLGVDALVGARAGLVMELEYERGPAGRWRRYRLDTGARWTF